MYTSTYSSSPVRTYTNGISSSNHPQQTTQPSTTIHFTSNYTMDEGNFTPRRMPNSYTQSSSTSIPIQTGVTPKKYSSTMNNSSHEPLQNRPSNTSYTNSYRPHPDQNSGRLSTSRYDRTPANDRSQSYDDLFHDQHRSHSSIYNSNSGLANHSQSPYSQQGRRELSRDFDDDLIVKSTDLSASHEQQMLDLVRSAFRKYDLTNQRELAGFLKRTADKMFSSCWHCIVGRQFSSYVTHEMNGFIYLTKGPLSILLFKSGA
jgi:dynein light chain LC8-type